MQRPGQVLGIPLLPRADESEHVGSAGANLSDQDTAHRDSETDETEDDPRAVDIFEPLYPLFLLLTLLPFSRPYVRRRSARAQLVYKIWSYFIWCAVPVDFAVLIAGKTRLAFASSYACKQPSVQFSDLPLATFEVSYYVSFAFCIWLLRVHRFHVHMTHVDAANFARYIRRARLAVHSILAAFAVFAMGSVIVMQEILCHADSVSTRVFATSITILAATWKNVFISTASLVCVYAISFVSFRAKVLAHDIRCGSVPIQDMLKLHMKIIHTMSRIASKIQGYLSLFAFAVVISLSSLWYSLIVVTSPDSGKATGLSGNDAAAFNMLLAGTVLLVFFLLSNLGSSLLAAANSTRSFEFIPCAVIDKCASEPMDQDSRVLLDSVLIHLRLDPRIGFQVLGTPVTFGLVQSFAAGAAAATLALATGRVA